MSGRDDLRQLTMLLHPFPSHLIERKPGSGGGDYVAHPIVEQRILDVLGPVDFEVVQVVRGYVPAKGGEKPKPALENAVVGVVCRMRAEIDGREVTVEEAGDVESPHNPEQDGARLKNAVSDAYKRCAMRLGVGLHLWAGDDFYLGEKLIEQDRERAGGGS